MKHKLQNLLKHKLQWLALLTAMLTVSQGVWGGLPATIYVKNTSNNDMYIYLWKDGAAECWTWGNSPKMTKLGESGGSYYFSYDVDCASFDKMIVRDNNVQSGDLTVPTDGKNLYDKPNNSWGTYTPPCTPPTAGTAYVQDGSDNWGSSLDIYGSSTVNLKVTGYDVGSSIQWQYSTDNSSWNDCAGETSSTASISGVNSTTYYRAQITNDGCSATTSAVTVTRKYRIRVKKNNILSSSAYIYIWDSGDGCNTAWNSSPAMTASDDGLWWFYDCSCNPSKILFKDATGDVTNNNHQTNDIDRSSSLTVFCYEVTSNKTDKNDKQTVSSADCCNTPTASGFTMSPTSVTYDGSPHAVTVTPKDGYGAVSDIKYSNSSTIPTAVGDYTVTADIAAEGDWCAVNDLEIGTFSITKHNQATLSITTSTDNRCTGVLPLQLAVSGGSTSGTVTYAETTHTGTVSVSPSGEITASTDASITVTATMAGDATYDDVVSDPVTFTFTESPVIYLTGTGANGASATYPWEYMTITVDRGTGKTSPSDLDVTFTEEPSFSSGTAPAHSVTITGTEGDKTYKLKSAKTVNDAHYYSVKANGSNAGCAAAEAEYKIYINQAPAEPSCN